MLRFWWNLVFICKIEWENRFCQYFCTFFNIFRENRDILQKIMIFSDMDMFTQFEFKATIFELKQIQIVFWNPENIFNKTTALDFSNLSLIFYYDWKCIWILKSPNFSKFTLFFSILSNVCKKQGRKSKIKRRCFVAMGLAILKPVLFLF